MLQFQDNDQDIPSSENSLFLPQSILNTVCNDLNINEQEGICLQGNLSHEKEFNFGSLQCSCSSLPTIFSDSNWNMGYQYGSNQQFTSSTCCLFEQQPRKQSECALPATLRDIEPFMGKETEYKPIEYGIPPGKQGPSSTPGDCRLLSCMQSQQPLNISMFNSSFLSQDSSLLQFTAGNTNNYNACLDSDCLDRIGSPSRNQYSYILDQNLDFNTLRAENIEQVNDKIDLSNFISMDNDEETILNVNESDEDSEIIVEESDTESEISIDVGPYMKDEEKSQPKKSVMRCFVCNLSYSEKLDFVQVNSSFPLTFISQTPVMLKLIEIIPTDMQTSVKFENNLICKRCLNLIDMIENLEVRLVSFKKAICDFVSRSSKDVSDEDWSLIQESSDICIDDNMEPLISKEVGQTGAAEENGETIETFNIKDKNVNHYEISEPIPDPINNEHSHKTTKDTPSDNNENIANIKENNIDTVLIEPAVVNNCNDSLSSKVNSNSSDKLCSKIQLSIDFKYQCDRCGKLYRREKELVFHLKKHMGEFLEKCTECGKGFMKTSNLEVHLRKHRKHICLNCRASFVSDIELSDHSKYCTGKKFTCSQCKLVFSSNLKLENHKEKHKVGSNICSICNKSFKHPSYLVAHMVSHSDKKPFSCEKCGRSYKNQNHLKRHLKTHSGLACHVCQKVFSSSSQLKSHLSIHAEEEECDICKKKFSKKYLLHHKKIHKNITNRKECPICKKLITTRLKVHMAKHSETKEYKCEICSIEFTFKHSLTKHVRLKHVTS